MRRNIVLGIAILAVILFACDGKHHSSSHVEADAQPVIAGSYGDQIDIAGAVPASHVVNELEAMDSVQLKVSGVITEVCQAKGCWMTMEIQDGVHMRVTFKDYGFFVPKDASGFQATIEGMAKREWVDVETLRHYAEDEGMSEEEIEAITEPEQSYNFVATGVVIDEIASE